MHSARPTILLTGFGPFPGIPANATSFLVPLLADKARQAFPGFRVVGEVLPTEWVGAPERLARLLETLEPDLALHFGVARGARGLEIEARAHNICRLSQDAVGALPDGAAVLAEGPERLPSRLPAAHIVRRLRARGIPAFISRDAGSYLCNALLYHSLVAASRHGNGRRVGFVHVPANLVGPPHQPMRPEPGCPLRWPDVLDGGVELIAAALGVACGPGVRPDRGGNGMPRRPMMRFQ